MKYIRMLTNAAAAGTLGAAYLMVLVLQLNPRLPLISAEAAAWFRALLSFYGLHLSIAIFVLLIARDVVAGRPLAPAWISVRLLAWLAALLAGSAAALSWLNLGGFRFVLGPEAADRMAEGAGALTAAALLLTAVAIARYSFGRRGGRLTAAILALIVAGSLAAPLSARATIAEPLPDVPPPRVSIGPPAASGVLRMVLIDGASLGYIRRRVGRGQLPNLARVLERGAWLDLATLKPTQAEPVWTAAATGKYPPANGVRSAARYRAGRAELVDLLPDYVFAHALVYLGYVTAEPVEPSDVTARPLWDILTSIGVPSGIVRWPVTFPVEPVSGYLVSDRFHQTISSPLRTGHARAAWPRQAADATGAVFDASMFSPWPEVLPAAVPADAPAGGVAPVRWDRIYAEAGRVLQAQTPARVVATRYQGLDTVAHTFLRYAEPHLFGDTRAADIEQFGGVLDRYYAYVDSEIGLAMDELQEGDLLLVVSGFGMEPVSLAKRALARLLGEPGLSGAHEGAPDGFLLAYGSHVEPGALPRGSIVDLAPTALYFLGLPVPRDMDGYARTDLFTAAFTSARPVTYIASYE